MRTLKNLGVVFDNLMIWKAHTEHLYKKVASRVSILGCSGAFVRKEAAILVYNIMNIPIFDSCDTRGEVCHDKTMIDYSACKIDLPV